MGRAFAGRGLFHAADISDSSLLGRLRTDSIRDFLIDWDFGMTLRRCTFALFAFALAVCAPAYADKPDVCELASSKSAAAVLGAPHKPMGPTEMGEETAPMCMWATADRRRSVKLQVWSKDELQVIGIYDAKTYYEKLQKDYSQNGGKVEAIAASAEPAFFVENKRAIKNGNFGSVVILRGERIVIADFVRVPVDKVIELAKGAAEKL